MQITIDLHTLGEIFKKNAIGNIKFVYILRDRYYVLEKITILMNL